jgi:hypothetical protein
LYFPCDLQKMPSSTLRPWPLPERTNIKFKTEKAARTLRKSNRALYQRYLARKDRRKPTAVTHRGQEWFKVVPIGATGSFSHMQ